VKLNSSLQAQMGASMKRRRFTGIDAALLSFPAAAADFSADNATVLPVDWSREVSPVRQSENIEFCWLAAAAMGQSWLAQRSVSMSEAAGRLGQDYESLFAAGEGLPRAKFRRWQRRF
jgi:hypothetical protein